MSDTLAQTIKLVFGSEGGYSNHPKDPGGATKYGITAATLGSWRKLGRKATPAEVQALTLAEATQILDRQYAQAIRYADLPAGLDYAVFDYAVNSGPSQAAKTLQRVLGVTPDGVIGTKTLEAIGNLSVEDIINDLCDDRLKFLRGLSTWATFGTGWSNRVRSVRANALGMAAGPAQIPVPKPSVVATLATGTPGAPAAVIVPDPAQDATDGLETADPADTRLSATPQGKGAIAASIGIASTSVGSAKDAIQPLTGHSWLIDNAFTVLTAGGAGLAIIGVIIIAAHQLKGIASGQAA